MNANEYQERARQTAIYPRPGTFDGLLYTTLGLAGEAGEVANKLKKVMRDDGSELTFEKRMLMLNEVGDVLWYAAQLCTELGVSMGAAMVTNLQKLEERQAANTLQGSGDVR